MPIFSVDEFLKKAGGTKNDIQIATPTPQKEIPNNFQGSLDFVNKKANDLLNTGSFVERVTPEDLQNPLSQENLAKTVLRPAYNMAARIGDVAKNVIVDIPMEVAGLIGETPKGQAPLKYAFEGTMGTLQNIVSPVLKTITNIGGAELGIVQAGLKKLTGIDLGQKEAQKAYDNLKFHLQTQKAEDVGQFLEGVYRWTQENPDQVALLGTQVNSQLSKMIGKKVDVIEVGAKPVTYPVEKSIELAQKGTELTAKTLKTVGRNLYKPFLEESKINKVAERQYGALQPKNLWDRVKNYVSDEEVGKKPVVEADTAIRQGIYGTEKQMGVQATRLSEELWNNKISPQLDSIKQYTDMDNFFESAKKHVSATELNPTRRMAINGAIDEIKTDYFDGGGSQYISAKDLNLHKSAWSHRIPQGALKNGKPISGAIPEAYETLRSNARLKILNDFEATNPTNELRQNFFDYGNLENIKEFADKTIDAARTKGITKQLWEGILDTAVTPVATTAGQIIYKIGNGIEYLIGKSGAGTVRDIVGNAEPKLLMESAPQLPAFKGRNKLYSQEELNPKTGQPKEGGLYQHIQNIEAAQKAVGLKKPFLTKGKTPETTLLQEARKYKSAEEFMKAQGKTIERYDRGVVKFEASKKIGYGDDLFFSPKGKGNSQAYGNVKSEMIILPNAKIMNGSNPIRFLAENDLLNKKSAIVKKLTGYDTSGELANAWIFKQGNPPKELLNNPHRIYSAFEQEVKQYIKDKYDGVMWNNYGEIDISSKVQYQIWNKDILKTRSQLTKIWEEANK